jgi:hypothetical protein
MRLIVAAMRSLKPIPDISDRLMKVGRSRRVPLFDRAITPLLDSND